MATKKKHKERSCRGYHQKEAEFHNFSNLTLSNANNKKFAKENKSSIKDFLGRFRKSKKSNKDDK